MATIAMKKTVFDDTDPKGTFSHGSTSTERELRWIIEDVSGSRDENAVIDFVKFDLSVSIFTEDRISACTKTKQRY